MLRHQKMGSNQTQEFFLNAQEWQLCQYYIIIRGHERPGSFPTGVIFFTGFFLFLRNKASDANIGIIAGFV